MACWEQRVYFVLGGLKAMSVVHWTCLSRGNTVILKYKSHQVFLSITYLWCFVVFSQWCVSIPSVNSSEVDRSVLVSLAPLPEEGLLKVKASYDVPKGNAISPAAGRSVPSSESSSRGNLFVCSPKNVEGVKRLKFSGKQRPCVFFAECHKQRANSPEMCLH